MGFADARQAVIAGGRKAAQRGWTPATAEGVPVVGSFAWIEPGVGGGVREDLVA